MAVIMETPKPTLPPRYRPPKSLPYRVKNGDSLSSLAQRLGMTAKALLQFNYNTDHPPFINYYLKNNVGCKIPTPDGKNYTFLNANPGVIYYPAVNPVLLFAPKQGEGPAIYMGGNKPHGLMIKTFPTPRSRIVSKSPPRSHSALPSIRRCWTPRRSCIASTSAVKTACWTTPVTGTTFPPECRARLMA